jgi:rhamnosyltransferase
MIVLSEDINHQHMAPKVAILMATYNGEAYISEQLSSIHSQENIECSIFISDDSSSDRTIELINAASENAASMTILPIVKSSGSAGQNFFRLIRDIDLADFQYFAFSDQDDIWLPKKISKAISKLKESNADGYSSSAIAFWPSGRKSLIKKNYPQKKYDYFFEGPGPGCTFVMSRRLFASLREFVVSHQSELKNIHYHDWFVYAYARSHNMEWIIDGESHIYYRQHGGNDTGANQGIFAAFFRAKKVWDFWARDQVYAIAKVLAYENILRSYFGGSIASKLRMTFSIYEFRRSTKDCFALLILAMAGRFKPSLVSKLNDAEGVGS